MSTVESSVAPRDTPGGNQPYNVLFLCTHNSARSIMAEAILNRMAGNRFRAFSAGSDPRGTINEGALTVLRNLGHDVSELRSKSWDELAAPGAPELDFIFTLCDDAAGETCPVWPGHPATAHWGIPDPSAAGGTQAEVSLAFDEAYRMIRLRLEAFTALPLASLDRVSLHRHLQEIGRLPGATDKARA